MADETTTTWSDLLREAKGPLQEALRYKTVLLSEVQRDKSPRRWNGKQVTVPIFTSPQQGTGMVTRDVNAGTQTVNVAQVVDSEQAAINSAIIAIAVSFSTQLMNQATAGDNGWADVVPTKMQRAEDVFSRVINEQMVGSGGTDASVGALLAACTATNNNTTVISIGTTANFYQLYPGRVIDVLVRSSGAAITDGAAQKITAYSTVAGTVTLTTAMTVANTSGIYIQGSYGNALQGVGAAVAITGTFEGINKANVDAWQGTVATPAAASDPTISIFDKAERLAMQRAGRTPAFYLCDPAVVDKYSQGLTVQARWAGEEGQLATGWTGIRYRNKLLIPEFDMPSGTAYGIATEDCALYTLDDGPDWDDHTGSMFQRFGARTLPLEAWLVWMLQFGFHSCNGFVTIGSLNRAS